MTQLTDETLIAYVDGELSPEEAAEVEHALKADQQVRDAVRIFRETADWSRRAYDDVLREPVPERLIRVASGQAGTGAAGPAKRTEASVAAPRGRIAALAMAASIALAVGIAGGFGISDLVGPDVDGPAGLMLVGTVGQGSDLHRALDTAASGTVSELSGAGDIMPLTTFVDRGGRYCREFEASLAGGGGSWAGFGIACRQVAGTWRVEAIGAAPDAGQVQGDQFVAASASSEAPMQVLVGAMSDNGTIPLDEEAALLAAGWK